MSGLTSGEISRIVYHWIGVEGGYLGDFSYASHARFYSEFCDLDIDPNQYGGTTRERFVKILSSADPFTQAQILRGVLERFPLDGRSPLSRNRNLYKKILEIIARLEQASPISLHNLQSSSEIVERAIADAEVLLSSTGAASAVDRIHTAMHGYLVIACKLAGLSTSTNASITALFHQLCEQHPKFQDLGARSHDISKILRAIASILDALNPIRNRASVAHPNPELLEKAEAMLVINVTRTLLSYLDMKLS